jgi:hypothetical protein
VRGAGLDLRILTKMRLLPSRSPSGRTLAAAVVALLVAGPAIGERQLDRLPPTATLAAAWDAERLPLPSPPLLRAEDVETAVARATAEPSDLVRAEVLGASVEGRPVHHVWLGRGPMRVLLWSQMHGDEPTATVALFDVIEYIARRRDQPHVRRLLDALTIHVVPMLNPDGAERYERRNAQGLDINRDALRLQTPEGRLLKALRDRLQPALGFNLHNQNWRTSVGTPPRPAAMSLLAVAFDEARTDSAGRRLARKVCAVIRGAVEPLAPGMLGRYDDDFEVRAFGDNITRWGTPVVLIETGPYPSRDPDAALVRMNYVAILSALDALATGRVHRARMERYETLPMNRDGLLFALVRGATVLNGRGTAPFVADIGISATRVVRGSSGTRRAGWATRIEDLGDLRVFGAIETIDAAGLYAAPLTDRDIVPGAEVEVPSDGEGPTIDVGQPGRVMILEPSGDRYRVVRLFALD